MFQINPIAGALSTPELLTLREWRRDRAWAPAGERFAQVVLRHLPVVYGSALALIPENPAVAVSVSVAAFETLAFRWRKLPRRTVVATWLLRTVCYAAARERKRLGLKRKPATATGLIACGLLEQVNALKPRQSAALVLAMLLHEPIETAAAALRSKPARIQKRIAKATAKLTRRFRKVARRAAKKFPAEATAIETDPLTALKALPASVPEEVQAAILTKTADWKPEASEGELVRSTIWAWRRRTAGRFFRRLGIALGATVLLAAVSFGSFLYLLDQGYLNLAFIQWSQSKMIKRFPEMAQPARPWPATPAEIAYGSSATPANAAELYGFTNIWRAKIRLTPEQWRAIQPRHIKPLPKLFQGGKVGLRNPNASRNGLAGAVGLDFPWAEGAFEFAGQVFEHVGVRLRGNGSYMASLKLQKQPYKVGLNRVKKGQGLAGIRTLNFMNALPDYSYLRDALAEKLFRELGAVAPRTAYAYLTLEVPGKFTDRPLGLYVLIEDVNRDFAQDRFGSSSAPIFKPVTYDLFADWGSDWSAYQGIYDLKTKASEVQRERLFDLAKLVTHADDEEFARKLPEYLDLEEYAAFVAGHVLLSSYDGYLSDGQNFYLYLDPRSNRFGFIPWDQDNSWGAFAYVGTAKKRENASIWKPAAYDNRFLNRVMKVEAFRTIYRRKLEQALAGPFTVAGLNREIDQLATILRPAIAAESQFRLQRFDIAVSATWEKGPRDGKQEDAFGPAAPAQQLKRFIIARAKSVRDQLDGKSQGSLLAGFGQENK